MNTKAHKYDKVRERKWRATVYNSNFSMFQMAQWLVYRPTSHAIEGCKFEPHLDKEYFFFAWIFYNWFFLSFSFCFENRMRIFFSFHFITYTLNTNKCQITHDFFFLITYTDNLNWDSGVKKKIVIECIPLKCDFTLLHSAHLASSICSKWCLLMCVCVCV